jgi:uncharacterized protein (TIGR02145 family)
MKYICLSLLLFGFLFTYCNRDQEDNGPEVPDPNADWSPGKDWFDARDSNVYRTVQIGDQVWMAENLAAMVYPDGKAIPIVKETEAWNALGILNKAQACCYYRNNDSLGNIYGVLYTWAAAMHAEESSDLNPSGVQGVCPSGWHLPSDEEWKVMERSLGMSIEESNKEEWRGTDEGNKLKETGYVHWESNYGSFTATNSSGFTALPGSGRGAYGEWNWVGVIGERAVFWTATEKDYRAWMRQLHYLGTGVWRIAHFESAGYSVRCVKD